jgi:transposase
MKEDAGSNKATHKPHPKAFKDEALGLAEGVGVPATAKEIARLKRQLAEQAEELSIVKKATTYFAKSLK